jgi:hypothetical protein
MINTTILGKSLGWFNKNEIYEMKNQITAVVYSIAFLDEKPDDHVYPFDVEDTIYFGMSGGMMNDYKFDRKNKHTGRGVLYSTFATRIKTHFNHLENIRDNSESKYHLFHEKCLPSLNPAKSIYVNLFVPDENKVEQFLHRSFISSMESEFILQYGFKYGRLPVMNLDEQYDRSPIDIQSASGSMRDFVSRNSLTEFLT